jgi:hypothetical protein
MVWLRGPSACVSRSDTRDQVDPSAENHVSASGNRVKCSVVEVVVVGTLEATVGVAEAPDVEAEPPLPPQAAIEITRAAATTTRFTMDFP